MVPDAGADPDTGDDLQLGHDDAVARHDRGHSRAAPPLRQHRRGQRLLLVPEPKGAREAEAPPATTTTNATSYSSSSSSFRRHAKFQPFEQGQEESEDQQATSRAQSNGSVFTTIDPREVELIPELSDPYDDTLAEDRYIFLIYRV